ncbi:hypothetical protein J7L09_00710 [bacterium]|nr:hypothetical protein [bacterium]
MAMDKIIEELGKHGIYVNKDRANLIRYMLYDDGTELYIIFYDNYKIHIKITPDGKTKVNAYPPIYKKQ